MGPAAGAAEEGAPALLNYATTYDRGATIQHWQLRDLVHCPQRDEELFCVCRHRTLRHDLNNSSTSVAQELSFEPTSMTVGHGYVAAGGQNSQLDVRQLAGGEIVYKVHLVCVGDNRHTYLYQATPVCYRQVSVFTEAGDAGMCCAWDAAGSLFAAAFQDGSAAVWDHRSTRVVAHYHTPLACRNVEFSPAPLDMMAFAEHRSRCHVVDCRMWDRQQVLDVGSQNCEPDISGLAFSPSGRRLYVGTEGGIAAYNVDTTSRRGFPAFELC
ncbi:hypothetical protein CHLNCDRAFT_144373 [Chlorella variabilis]|uniref:DUF2415 domain-containing protein n=1 Tax=Chlorella variabilis TaxID=554065 RepID=E1ZBA7_CHLVA|nr:hypothetical protein CHLNCDRAFT_144373 [Chlorella variabilis]EFN56612.1 hypothetical protein CHLNCDRAFT_144373 [Chlorella variabilis]|eukprot:XP_005848714.1 hypothetical protein CHLNCDRAFT_144373 [Chlorella variabilis]